MGELVPVSYTSSSNRAHWLFLFFYHSFLTLFRLIKKIALYMAICSVHQFLVNTVNLQQVLPWLRGHTCHLL